ncbi:MraY family glycosyltransferase [Microbulbifer aggregans]|uniref:MraY family glycosyltransferase n=1 Tax=Microbulbifer aggregans TaxID=1769779 RepID=UPI001CFE2B28|nr:glycosyltransferase family 4 protein [Microbulbifer aggregans]
MDVLYFWFGLSILAAVICLVSMQFLLARMGQFALDVPNHRSLHEKPVPRTGGWAIWFGVFSALLVSPLSLNVGVAVAFASLLAVSVTDDLRSLSARVRFAVQLIAVSSLVLSLWPGLAWWLVPVLVVSGVWVVNLYNFMDGMDGFSASMTIIGFGSLAIICAYREYWDLAGICTVVAAATLVFLYYNWPVARIFMGDAGSTTVGLAAFAVSIYGWSRGAFHPIIPLIVFSPFWLDATFTLLRRIFAGERWWEAHRQHVYQRMALKYGVKKALVGELSVMAGTASAATILVICDIV